MCLIFECMNDPKFTIQYVQKLTCIYNTYYQRIIFTISNPSNIQQKKHQIVNSQTWLMKQSGNANHAVLIYKCGRSQPKVQPRSKPAPTRPKPTAKAIAYLQKLHFFLFLFPLLQALSPFRGIQGRAGNNVEIWCSLIPSWRQRLSSCSIWSHCLYAKRCDACLKRSFTTYSFSSQAFCATISASLARVWEWRRASNSWALPELLSEWSLFPGGSLAIES